jgi:hypothetical protein
MKTLSLRASLPSAFLLVLLTAAAAAAQTAVALPAGPSLASQLAPLAGVRTTESLVPAASAAADDAQRRPADPQPGGPMTVVPVRNAFVVAPEVKFGTVNHRSATFAGVTGGVLMDNRLFVGAGGYWLANNDPGFEMGYAGAIVGWYLTGGGPIDVNLTGLIGGGWSTLTSVGAVPLGMGRHGHPMYPQPGAWYVASDFFIAEPGANVCIRITRSVWINAGVGYRYVSGAYGLDNEMRGASGSVAVTFGRR